MDRLSELLRRLRSIPPIAADASVAAYARRSVAVGTGGSSPRSSCRAGPTFRSTSRGIPWRTTWTAECGGSSRHPHLPVGLTPPTAVLGPHRCDRFVARGRDGETSGRAAELRRPPDRRRGRGAGGPRGGVLVPLPP